MLNCVCLHNCMYSICIFLYMYVWSASVGLFFFYVHLYLCVCVCPPQSRKGRSCSSQREVTVVLPNGQYVVVRCDIKSKARDVFDMVVAHANLVEHFYFGLAFLDGKRTNIFYIYSYIFLYIYTNIYIFILIALIAQQTFKREIHLFILFYLCVFCCFSQLRSLRLKKLFFLSFCRWWIFLFGAWNKNLQNCAWQLEKRADILLFGVSSSQIFCWWYLLRFVSTVLVFYLYVVNVFIEIHSSKKLAASYLIFFSCLLGTDWLGTSTTYSCVGISWRTGFTVMRRRACFWLLLLCRLSLGITCQRYRGQKEKCSPYVFKYQRHLSACVTAAHLVLLCFFLVIW